MTTPGREDADSDHREATLAMSRNVVLSGCSGGGKSTLLASLRARGYPVVEEPGRRIVREQLLTGGTALPWLDGAEFARRCVACASDDLESTSDSRWTFFDRGLVDAASALRHYGGTTGCARDLLTRYHRQVFLVPPWEELFSNDAERQLDFHDAVSEYDRLVDEYTTLGYQCVVLPRVGVDDRVRSVLRALNLPVD
ncbi:AAA family ATPase [Williamsia sp. SKLECPSW1]